MASQVMRITMKAYDHQLIDASAKKIIETVKKTGSTGERTGADSDEERGSYHPSRSAQVQRFQRAVRAENSQETDRYHRTDAEDSRCSVTS